MEERDGGRGERRRGEYWWWPFNSSYSLWSSVCAMLEADKNNEYVGIIWWLRESGIKPVCFGFVVATVIAAGRFNRHSNPSNLAFLD